MSHEIEGLPRPPHMNKDPLVLFPNDHIPIMQARMAGVLKRLDAELVAGMEVPKKTEVAEVAEAAFQKENVYVFGTVSDTPAVSRGEPQEPTPAVMSDPVVPVDAVLKSDPITTADTPSATGSDAAQPTQNIDNQTVLGKRRGATRNAQSRKKPATTAVGATISDVVVPPTADAVVTTKDVTPVVTSAPDKPVDVSVPPVIPVDIPKAPDITPVQEPKKGRADQFVVSLMDGEYILTSPDGKEMKKYVKKGDEIFEVEQKDDSKKNDSVVNYLKEKWILRAVINNPFDAPVPPVVPVDILKAPDVTSKPKGIPPTLTDEVILPWTKGSQETGEQNYDELHVGDVWACYDTAGNVIARRRIQFFLDSNGEKWADVEKENDGISTAGTYSLEAVRKELREGGYILEQRKMSVAPSVDTTLVPDTPKSRRKILPIIPIEPAQGETAPLEPLMAIDEKVQYYVPGLEGEYTVERTANGYRFFNVDYDSSVPLQNRPGTGGFLTEEQMQETIRTAHWERAKTQEEKEREKGTPTSQELLDKIAGLETLVKEERFKYAEADYKKKSVLGRLSTFFRKSLEGPPDPDSEFWRIRYTNALAELQNAQLERIKLSGVSGDALKQEMAGLLQYYKVNEVVELYQARTQVRLETKKEEKSFGERAIDTIDNFGRAYNKLGWKKKLVIAGAVLGGAGLLTATGGVAGAAAGGAMIFARKVMTSAGGGVALDAVFEQAGKYFGDKFDQREIEKQMEALDKHLSSGSAIGVEDYVKNMEARLSEELQNIEQKFQRRKKLGKARKVTAFTLASVSSFASYAFHGTSGSGITGHDARLDAYDRAHPATGATLGETGTLKPPVQGVTPESGSPMSREEAYFREVNMTEPVTSGATSAVAETGPVSVTKEIATLRESYPVTAFDGKRGLWGIIDKRLPDTIPKGPDRNRAIQSLINAAKLKIDALSPAERVAAGFAADGNMDMIQRGAILHFDQVLTSGQIQTVLDGKSIAGPGVVSVAKGVVEATPHAPIDQADFDEAMKKLAHQPEAPANSVAEAREALVKENIALTDTQSYLSAHPEQLKMFSSTLGKVQNGIFAMNPGEAGVPMEYDYAVNGQKLGATKISDVLKNLKGFESGRLGYNRDLNPLHHDQMKALQKFITVAEKTFGPEVAQVEAGESISHYTERMTTASLKTGKDITDFWKDSFQSSTIPGQILDQPNPTAGAREVVAPRIPVAEHVVVRPESVMAANETPVENTREVAIFRQACAQNVAALRHDILLTPPAGVTSMAENFHLAKYDYALNPSLGRIYMHRVLEVSQELQYGALRPDRGLDWARYPLHPTQVESLARAVTVAQDPRVLGAWGAPMPDETIDRYTARIGVALTKANKAQLFSALLHGRGVRFAA